MKVRHLFDNNDDTTIQMLGHGLASFEKRIVWIGSERDDYLMMMITLRSFVMDGFSFHWILAYGRSGEK